MTTEFESVPKDDGVPDYYADSLNMALGPYGFGLEFGVTPFPDFGAGLLGPVDLPPARPVVRVRVSPQLAQAIKFLLINNIAVYESLFGEIKVPEARAQIPSDDESKGGQA